MRRGWTLFGLVIAAGFALVGCGREDQPIGRSGAPAEMPKPPLAQPAPRPVEAGYPPTDDASIVRDEKEYRENQCQHDGEEDWSDLPRGRQRAAAELMSASARGDEAAVDLLLAQGTDPEGVSDVYLAPLAMAAKCDRVGVLRRLLKAGVPLERRYEWQVGPLIYRQTALMIAAQNGSEETVAALLAAGADPNLEQLGKLEGERRFQPTGDSLFLAVTNPVARLLLEAGADPNAGNPTTLMHVAGTPNLERVRMLLQYGGDPNRRDSDGLTAVDHARRSRARTAEVIALLEEAMAAPPVRRPAKRARG